MASNWLVAKSHQCFVPFGLPIAKLRGMPRERMGQAGVIREPVGRCVLPIEGGDGLSVRGSN